MHLVARVGEARVGIVHGDAASLAGLGLRPRRSSTIRRTGAGSNRHSRDAKVDVFASTHTCLPAFRRFDGGVVANNGAAGMPNFAGTHYGLLTRIALAPFRGPERLYGVEAAGAQVEALRIDYDHGRWVERFLAAWPEKSPAHDSYFRRISQGTRFALAQAVPRAA